MKSSGDAGRVSVTAVLQNEQNGAERLQDGLRFHRSAAAEASAGEGGAGSRRSSDAPAEPKGLLFFFFSKTGRGAGLSEHGQSLVRTKSGTGRRRKSIDGGGGELFTHPQTASWISALLDSLVFQVLSESA